MQYKTIVLELLQQQPEMFASLTSSNSLLSTTNQLAAQLRENHLDILDQLREQQPSTDEIQLKSQAMEIAIDQLRDSLSKTPAMDESEPLSLDEAMAFLRRHTPRD